MPANMPGREVKVTSQVDGSETSAVLLMCVSCKHDKFLALLIGDGRNLHLQCLNCGECHCAHDSECNLPLGGDGT